MLSTTLQHVGLNLLPQDTEAVCERSLHATRAPHTQRKQNNMFCDAGSRRAELKLKLQYS